MTARRILGVNPRYMSLCDECRNAIEALLVGRARRPKDNPRADVTRALSQLLHSAADYCIVCQEVRKVVLNRGENKRAFEGAPRQDRSLQSVPSYATHPQHNKKLEELIVSDISSTEVEQGRSMDTFDQSVRYNLSFSGLSDTLLLRLAQSGTEIKFDVSDAHDPGEVDDTLQYGNLNITPLCRYWLHVCGTSHDVCKSRQAGWQPTRLMHLQNGIATLVEASESQIHAEYATLSHCWGSSQHIVLTSANISKLKTGRPISSFPKTFSEAMLFVTSIDINYIWIDSLCILQKGPGSREDWERESLTMHKVYSNGTINVGATSASCSSDGLWAIAPIERLPYALAHMSDWQNASQMRRYRIWQKDAKVAHSLTGPEGPLLKRGWVVQERMLSSRTIHFARNGLWWQCRHMFCSDQTPFDIQNMLPTAPHPGSITLVNDLPKSHKEILDAWLSVVDIYSETSLTYPDIDKLRAVEGYMQLLNNVSGETFIFGHPLRHLHQSLLWAAQNGVTRSPSRNIPAWSWASVDGAVECARTYKSSLPSLAVLIEPPSSTTIALLGRLLVGHANTAKDKNLFFEKCTWWRFRIQAVHTQLRAAFDDPMTLDALVKHAEPVLVLPLLRPDTVFEHAFMLLLKRTEDGSYQRLGVAGVAMGCSPTQSGIMQAYARARPQLIILS